MIRALAGAIVFGLATASSYTPAFAADAGTLGCIRDKAGPIVVSQLIDQLATGFNAKKLDDVDPDWSPLKAPLAACRDANSWSDNATSLAAMIAIATIMRDASARVLPARGGDPALIARAYQSLPIETRRNLLSDSQTVRRSAITALVIALRARKITVDEALGEQIGVYAGALSLIEFKTAEFVAA